MSYSWMLPCARYRKLRSGPGVGVMVLVGVDVSVGVTVDVGVNVAVGVAVMVGIGVLVGDGERVGAMTGEAVTEAHPARIITRMTEQIPMEFWFIAEIYSHTNSGPTSL
jgi:hypothetical protein